MKTRTLKSVMLALAITLAFTAVILLNRDPGKHRSVAGVIEPLQHVAVTDITNGIKHSLADCCELLVRNASTDKTAIPQILAQFKDRNVDLFIPIFTQTAQATKAAIPEKPIVFAAVTDPVAAGLLSNPDVPESNITGVSDLWPIGSTLALIRRILPESRLIGLVYDPGDPNSESTLTILKQEAPQLAFELQLRPVHSTAEIAPSLESLGSDIDVLFTANDVTVTAAFPALVTFARDRKIPLFAGDYSSVARGAIGAVGQNYYEIGIAAGNAAKRILGGTPISEVPIAFTTGGDIYLNAYAASQMGVTLSSDVLEEAKKVYHEISD